MRLYGVILGSLFLSVLVADVKVEPMTREKEMSTFRFWEEHNSNWYLGGAGFANDSFSGKSTTVVTARTGNEGDIETQTYQTHSPSWGYKVYLGYNLNEIVAFEMKFAQGIAPNKFFIKSIDIPDDPLFLNNRLNFKLTQISFGPATLLSIPVSRYFMPYFKGGFYVFRFKKNKHYSPDYNQPTTQTMHSVYWDTRLIAGYGVRSQILDWFGLRLEYECATNPIINTHVDLAQGNINLSGYFTF